MVDTKCIKNMRDISQQEETFFISLCSESKGVIKVFYVELSIDFAGDVCAPVTTWTCPGPTLCHNKDCKVQIERL